MMKSTCVVALALGLCLATENAEAQSGKAKPGATWYQRNIKAPYQRCVSCVTAPVRAGQRAVDNFKAWRTMRGNYSKAKREAAGVLWSQSGGDGTGLTRLRKTTSHLPLWKRVPVAISPFLSSPLYSKSDVYNTQKRFGPTSPEAKAWMDHYGSKQVKKLDNQIQKLQTRQQQYQ
jgi:hypothetical protein